MTENGLFVLGGPETQLHDILWAVHDGKNRGRSEGEENFGEFPVTVGGRGLALLRTMSLDGFGQSHRHHVGRCSGVHLREEAEREE